VTDLRIIRAGVNLHHVKYDRPVFIRELAPKGSYTLRFTIRGSIAPAPEWCEYGVEAKFYHQRNRYHSSFPGPHFLDRPHWH
jgi:hypothetical protein